MAQKPGKVSTEPGCAADVVCSSVLIVANTTRPCKAPGKSHLAREGDAPRFPTIHSGVVQHVLVRGVRLVKRQTFMHGLDVPRNHTSSSLLLTLLSRSPVLAPSCMKHQKIKKGRSERHNRLLQASSGSQSASQCSRHTTVLSRPDKRVYHRHVDSSGHAWQLTRRAMDTKLADRRPEDRMRKRGSCRRSWGCAAAPNRKSAACRRSHV